MNENLRVESENPLVISVPRKLDSVFNIVRTSLHDNTRTMIPVMNRNM